MINILLGVLLLVWGYGTILRADKVTSRLMKSWNLYLGVRLKDRVTKSVYHGRVDAAVEQRDRTFILYRVFVLSTAWSLLLAGLLLVVSEIASYT